jgi:hypothetical protein
MSANNKLVRVGDLNRLKLAAYICQLLSDNGINVVLSGGSVVSIYSAEEYVSVDLDFVDISLKTSRQISQVLQTVGFKNYPINSRHFVHSDTELTIEFPSAPLMVGDEYIPESRVDMIKGDTGVLKLLSPTDCVKDRLAGFYYFGDNQCFEQALLVANAQPINIEDLKQWHKKEGQKEGFEIFIKVLSDSK